MGARQHRRVRWRPGAGHHRPVGRRRLAGRRAAGDAARGRAVPAGGGAEHARHLLHPALAADITRACAAKLSLNRDLPAVDPFALPAAADAVTATMERRASRWGAAARAQVARRSSTATCCRQPVTDYSGAVPLLVGPARHRQRLLAALSGMLGTVTEAAAAQSAELFAPDPRRYRESLPPTRRTSTRWCDRTGCSGCRRCTLRWRRGRRCHPLLRADLAGPGDGWGVRRLPRVPNVPLVFGDLTAGQPAPC